MSTHPVFLIVRAKLGEVTKALAHMNALDVQQRALRVEHPDLYSPDAHAESMVTNVQGIYTHFEAILKTLANTIDGFSPSGEAWHRDLLLQAAAVGTDRPEMISPAVLDGMSELLRFRHAVRNNYASSLRHEDVFRNLVTLQRIAPTFLSDIERLIERFGTTGTSSPPADRG